MRDKFEGEGRREKTRKKEKKKWKYEPKTSLKDGRSGSMGDEVSGRKRKEEEGKEEEGKEEEGKEEEN